MPFIKEERRKMVDKDQYASVSKTLEGIQVGDRCYFYYKPMVDRWTANPRWTTAHEIYKDMICEVPYEIDDNVAVHLAWQCFFYFHVVPYEEEKREENGDI